MKTGKLTINVVHRRAAELYCVLVYGFSAVCVDEFIRWAFRDFRDFCCDEVDLYLYLRECVWVRFVSGIDGILWKGLVRMCGFDIVGCWGVELFYMGIADLRIWCQ